MLDISHSSSVKNSSMDSFRCKNAGFLGLLRGRVWLEFYCDLYVQCVTTLSIISCRAGQYFNGKQCVDSHLADCPYDPCRGLADGTQIAERQTCNGFYSCLAGRSVYNTCPCGQRFSEGRCVTNSTCPRGYHPRDVDSCDRYNYLSFRQLPGKFFQLDTPGVYRARPCPQGLVFDTNACVCNFPY